ncbi:MAG: oxidoreductase, partial [Clostridiales bacterium]|nr:oxidoreductase [Clostridiales bacterium]
MNYAAILQTVGSLALISGVLSLLISLAEKVLNNYGVCELDINDGAKKISVQGGASLLSTLAA